MWTDMEFYRNKRVLVTGHTGFKGAWMCQVLYMAGADVYGYALASPTSPSLYELCHLSKHMNSVIGDIRDLDHLKKTFVEIQPEIVIHMAAQPLVRESYRNPVYTYETNVMGTVNVMECARLTPAVRSIVNVTTDKVYRNREWEWGYRESDELDGYDPYSNSKSCSELVTSAYKNSFFADRDIAVSTARAGNVIGGGDFAAERIIPDCIRAAMRSEDILVRNPSSVRPYQHVLEPVLGYLMIAKFQYENAAYAGSYNIGPNDADCITTSRLVTLFCDAWNSRTGNKLGWIDKYDGGPHEADYLKLDCSKLIKTFGWHPRWHVDKAVDMVADWQYRYAVLGEDAGEIMQNQINCFESW